MGNFLIKSFIYIQFPRLLMVDKNTYYIYAMQGELDQCFYNLRFHIRETVIAVEKIQILSGLQCLRLIDIPI